MKVLLHFAIFSPVFIGIYMKKQVVKMITYYSYNIPIIILLCTESQNFLSLRHVCLSVCFTLGKYYSQGQIYTFFLRYVFFHRAQSPGNSKIFCRKIFRHSFSGLSSRPRIDCQSKLIRAKCPIATDPQSGSELRLDVRSFFGLTKQQQQQPRSSILACHRSSSSS